jgi:hypothetical protein
MEIHHIVPQAKGGEDTEANGVPLCLDCHAEVGAYNPQHPKGRRFTPSELQKHKEQWFAICSIPPWHSLILTNSLPELSKKQGRLDKQIFDCLRLDDHRPAQQLANMIMLQSRALRKDFVKSVFKNLQADDEETRWKFSLLIQELLLWEPKLISSEILENMSVDTCFFVRSSAAVCYYYLAALDPVSVPLDVLGRLAAYNEDWYVCTPATSALLRMARVRPVAIDIIARGLNHKDNFAREYAATALRRLGQKDWDLITSELIDQMLQNSHAYVKEVGEICLKIKQKKRKKSEKDYSLF